MRALFQRPFPLLLGLLVISAGCDLFGLTGETELRPLTEHEKRVVESSNRFGFDLLGAVNALETEHNLFISPFSVSMALGMTVNGAEGRTREQMLSVLALDHLSMSEVNASYRGLINLFDGLDAVIEFDIANSIWHHHQFHVEAEFIETNRRYFDSEVHAIDFESPGAVDLINGWVAGKTNDRIPELIDVIPPDAVMYLINAIYFNGAWTYRFDPEETQERDFFVPGGDPVKVPLMGLRDEFPYYQNGELQAIDLPYGNGQYSMTVVLPAGDVNDFVADLDDEAWNRMLGQMEETEVAIRLPKFRLEYDSDLARVLEAMGMPDAFDEHLSDFAGINGQVGKQLVISRVLHQTFVEVDEEGTEAAAATAVEMSRVIALEPGYPTMVVNRPFVFAIRERHSGTVLFIGKVMDPTA